jgi:glycosyltransferase involved in cell wall biosynthesis
MEGVDLALFPARTVLPGVGFAGVSSPGLLRRLAALTAGVDVVHVHAARDLVTMPAVDWLRRHRVPYVLQTHGMIDESSNPLARPLDAALTRPGLQAARRVFFLTERERHDLIAVGGNDLRLEELPNGVPAPEAAAIASGDPEVLYLARLARRKRPVAFVEMAARVAQRFPAARFRLVGPDEGEAQAVSAHIEMLAGAADVQWEGPLDPSRTAERMAAAHVYVLPAVDEPYPMSVLEAMALGLPVVVTDSCGLAPAIARVGAGIVVTESADSLAAAVEALLDDPASAREMGAAGRRFTRDQLGMPAIAEQLERAYRR